MMNFESLIGHINQVQDALQAQAAHAVNLSLTARNWLVGYYIVEFEQHGEDRARYGENLLDKLARKLSQKGFEARRLREYRQFYRVYPQIGDVKDNASDKFLDIVETINLDKFFKARPTIQAIVTAGEKATGVIAEKAGVEVPKTGEVVHCTYPNHVHEDSNLFVLDHVPVHAFDLYRMPSSSRAYPLSLEKKADAYRTMFRQLGYEV